MLAIGGQWVAAAVVFLIGTPVFWVLRNKAVAEAVAPHVRPSATFARATAHLPDAYEIPKEVERKLSSTFLEDVPVAVRVGSPLDASTKEVEASLRKLGFLPPGTNYGVVYRVCFVPLMAEGEEPLHIRFGFVSTGHAPSGLDPAFASPEQAWVLLTTEALWWHAFDDRVPGMPMRSDLDLIPGARDVVFNSTVSFTVGDVQIGPGGMPAKPIVVRHRFDSEPDEVWHHTFLIAPDPSTDQLIEDMRTAIERNRG